MKASATNKFFIGKGGVGKSTTAALTALELSEQGKKVLLVSMDPAHNQSDIFETSLSEKPSKLTARLSAIEIDLAHWIRKYLKDVEREIAHSYNYLTALNLEKHLGIIKYSPGIEEYALLLAFQDICRRFQDMDALVFDMPPTALTLKFFALPYLSLTWLEKLLELRQQILAKREIITKIKFGKKQFERDKISNKLTSQIRSYDEMRQEFTDRQKTNIHLVLNVDKLALNESKMILQYLRDLHLSVFEVLVNKHERSQHSAELLKSFPDLPVRYVPFSPRPLIGLPALLQFLHAEIPVHVAPGEPVSEARN